jgi:hypothetical protein
MQVWPPRSLQTPDAGLARLPKNFIYVCQESTVEPAVSNWSRAIRFWLLV